VVKGLLKWAVVERKVLEVSHKFLFLTVKHLETEVIFLWLYTIVKYSTGKEKLKQVVSWL
jgi:hypothetical protein